MQPSKGGPFRSLKIGPSWKIHLKKKRIQLSKKFNSILTAVLIFLRHPKKTNAGSIVQWSLSLIPLIDAMRAQRRFPNFRDWQLGCFKKNIYQNGPIALPFLLPADLTYKANMENTPIFLDIYLWRLYGNTRKGGIPAQVCHAKLLDGLLYHHHHHHHHHHHLHWAGHLPPLLEPLRSSLTVSNAGINKGEKPWSMPYATSIVGKKKIKQYNIYIYMGSGRFPGPMELLLQQLVRVSKTRWRWFNLSKPMLLQPLIKKLEVLVMTNQWTTYCINDNNDERWMVVLIDFYLTFCKN